MNFRHAGRNHNRRQIGAAVENRRSQLRHALREFNFLQSRALLEHAATDFGHRSGELHARQVRAVRQHAVAHARHGIRNHDLGQAAAIHKRALADCRHRGRNADARQARARKRLRADRRQPVGQADAGQPGAAVKHAVRNHAHRIRKRYVRQPRAGIEHKVADIRQRRGNCDARQAGAAVERAFACRGQRARQVDRRQRRAPRKSVVPQFDKALRQRHAGDLRVIPERIRRDLRHLQAVVVLLRNSDLRSRAVVARQRAGAFVDLLKREYCRLLRVPGRYIGNRIFLRIFLGVASLLHLEDDTSAIKERIFSNLSNALGNHDFFQPSIFNECRVFDLCYAFRNHNLFQITRCKRPPRNHRHPIRNVN